VSECLIKIRRARRLLGQI